MEASRWYFSREQLAKSPSHRAGLDPDKELSYRQQAANLLQDMGQRLNVSQLTINTAIVYMHRFYMVQSFTQFHRNIVAPAALFLAAKVEEQPRKLEHVIKVAHACLNPLDPPPDTRREAYLQQAQDLVILESIILQTLGFEITIDHPHTHVVKCTQLVRASKDLAQTSYFMATNSLHLTTFSLQYTPPVVACVCIHLACKWSNWEIPVSTDGKPWWEYVDVTVTLELLDELTHEFLQILEKTPNRLKRIRNWRACQAARKPKVEAAEDNDNEECLSEETIFNMISRSASDSTLTGLMNLSASSEAEQDPGSTSSTAEPWILKLDSVPGHRTANSTADHPLLQDSTAGHAAQKHSTKSLSSSKVSLKEYRAKHAEELAAQKRQLENMEASVKEQYAYAAQNLLVQQKRDREQEVQQQEASPSPVLKIPIAGSENPERPPPDKSALKLKIPVAVAGGEKPPPLKPDEIKVRIKMPPSVRHGSSDETSGKSKEKHRSGSLNHHHHHHHHNHSHKHSHSQPAGTSKRPSDSKYSSLQSSLVHKSYGSSSQSRKRPLPEEPSTHDLLPKVSKSSKLANMTFPFPSLSAASVQLPVHIPDSTDLSYLQSSHRAKSSHTKSDKNSGGANGHNASQAVEYQDTVNMLHSLLSAQGMQPTQPPSFPFVHNYGEFRGGKPPVTSRTGTTDKLRAPPLPSEPPPPLPPLPK
ncbi:cyclin-T1 [Rhinatrema bivittatum]|uniref:cyclin-T1 n=1 Tax=Rhinatrema bivittatum TaxID=194408 RepID=UPI0011275262|nr:cyclin-T1 [Rhinatrema bivittatum]